MFLIPYVAKSIYFLKLKLVLISGVQIISKTDTSDQTEVGQSVFAKHRSELVFQFYKTDQPIDLFIKKIKMNLPLTLYTHTQFNYLKYIYQSSFLWPSPFLALPFFSFLFSPHLLFLFSSLPLIFILFFFFLPFFPSPFLLFFILYSKVVAISHLHCNFSLLSLPLSSIPYFLKIKNRLNLPTDPVGWQNNP